MFLAVLVPVVLVVQYSFTPYLLITLAFLLLAIPTSLAILRSREADVLNPALGKTAKALLIYSVLMSLGVFLNYV